MPDPSQMLIPEAATPPPDPQQQGSGQLIPEATNSPLAPPPRPQWTDDNIPIQDRLSDFLQSHAKGLRPWSETQANLQDYFPGMNAAPLQKNYEQTARLEGWRAGAQQQISQQDLGYWLNRRFAPFASPLIEAADQHAYATAREKLQKGEATDEDLKDMAFYERMQSLKGNPLAETAMQLPRQALEAFIGGKVVQAGAGMLAGEGFLASGATAAAGQGTAATSMVGKYAQGAGFVATQPSIWAPEYGKQRMEGSTPVAAAGKTLAMAGIQAAVFGTLGKIPEAIPGTGVGPWLARTAAGTGAGIVEQQTVDALASAAHLDTGYGVVGDLVRGKNGDAWGKLSQQALGFGVFSAMHGGKSEPLKDMAASMQKMEAAGYSPEEARQAAEGVHAGVLDALHKYPDMPMSEIRDSMHDALNGPAGDYAKAMLDGLDELDQVSKKADAARKELKDSDVPVGDREGLVADKIGLTDEQKKAWLEYPKYPLGSESERRTAQAPDNPTPTVTPPASATAPPEPTPATPPVGHKTPWHDAYAQARAMGKTHEGAAAEADKAHADGQTWVHSGTQFQVGEDGIARAYGSDGKPYTVNELGIPVTEGTWPHGGNIVRLLNESGQEAAKVSFIKQADGSFKANLVENNSKKVQGKNVPGLGRILYDYSTQAGDLIRPSDDQIGGDNGGKSFWKNNAELALPESARSFKKPASETLVGPKAPYSKPTLTPFGRVEGRVETGPGQSVRQEPARQPYTKPTLTEGGQAIAGVKMKMANGMRLTPEDVSRVFAAAGLSSIEQHVLQERLLNGRSHSDIAGDPEAINPATNQPYTRQRIKQLEQSGLEKLGGGDAGTVASLVHASDKADAVIDLAEKGQRVSAKDLQVDPDLLAPKKKARQNAVGKAVEDLSNLADQLIAEAGDGELSPEREKFYENEAARLHSIVTGGGNAKAQEPEQLPQSVESSSVRPSASGGVQAASPVPEAASAAAPTAQPQQAIAPAGPAATAGPNPANAGPPSAAPERGPVGSGVVAPAIIARGQALRAAGDVTGWNAWKSLVREHYPDEANALIKKLGGEKVKSAGGPRNEGVNRQINYEGRKYQEEHLFHDAKLAHEQADALTDHAPAEVAKAVQDGLQAGATATEDEGEGLRDPADPNAASDTSFDFGANVAAFLHDEGGFVDPAVLAAYGRSLYERVVGTARRVSDGLGELSGKMFPATTRSSRVSGEALARYVSSRTYVKEAVPAFIDKVGGANMTPQQDHLWGTTFAEQRVRHAKADDLQRAQAASAAAAQARANNQPEEAARQAKLATQYQQAAGQRTTFVGKPDSPLPDEATYQAALASPEYKAAMQRWQKEFLPKQEANFRMAQGLDDQDPIESRTQLPGRAMNMKAISEDADVGPGTVFTGGQRGNLKNLKTKQSPFANEASLSAPAYDTRLSSMIDNTLTRGEEIARKAEFLRTATAEDVARPGRPGQQLDGFKELPFAKAPKNLEGSEPGDVMYFKKEIADEVRKAYAVDEPFRIPGVTDAANLLSKTALASTVEAAYHSRNLLTMMTKPGMNPVDFFTNGFKLLTGDQGIRDSLVELARIGALKGEGFAPERSPLDPRTWMGKFLNVVDRSMRLTANDAFDRLKRHGYDIEQTETNRRDFINQLGQYNQRAQAKGVQFLRDSGLGPFATAGTNYYMQGLRSLFLDPGVKAGTWQSAAALRLEVAARQVAVLGAVALVNYLAWGRADGDDSTPLGGMKTGVGPDGKTRYFDMASLFSTLPRGMRETGLLALAEGTRRGERPAAIIDRAKNDAVEAALHPMLGPPGAFAYTAITGKNTLGMQLAAKPEPGGSQSWENLKAALKTANPVYGSLSGADHPGQEQSLGMRAAQLAGPYNPMRERANPVVSDFYDAFQAAQQSHQQYTQNRQRGVLTPGYTVANGNEYRRLATANLRLVQLNKAMRAAKTDEERGRLRALQVQVATQALGR